MCLGECLQSCRTKAVIAPLSFCLPWAPGKDKVLAEKRGHGVMVRTLLAASPKKANSRGLVWLLAMGPSLNPMLGLKICAHDHVREGEYWQMTIHPQCAPFSEVGMGPLSVKGVCSACSVVARPQFWGSIPHRSSLLESHCPSERSSWAEFKRAPNQLMLYLWSTVVVQ